MSGTYEASGEIDRATAPAFAAALHDTIDDSDAELVFVDCTHVTFMDSAGFHALIDATKYAIRHHHRLVIRNMSAKCSRIIRICDSDGELHVQAA
jgi:anti-anti-sigma factor